MKKFWLALATLAVSGCVSTIDSNSDLGESTETLDSRSDHGKPEPEMLGVHWAKGNGPGGGGGSPQLLWHGGAIMTSAVVEPIYWGTGWSNPSFVGDKQAGLDSLYSAIGSSPYIRTNVEYTGTNGQVGQSISFGGDHVDLSAGPNHAPRTSTILGEVCRVITNPVANGYYPVYTDLRRGGAGYCAWHSYGSCGGVPVQFGFFFNLDGDSGCDPQDSGSGRSQGLSALANVSGHELSEAITDPRNGGWYDASGAENADKCAWKFDQPAQLSDGSNWRIQGNWSNAAYSAGTGLPNRSGQNGCLYND